MARHLLPIALGLIAAMGGAGCESQSVLVRSHPGATPSPTPESTAQASDSLLDALRELPSGPTLAEQFLFLNSSLPEESRAALRLVLTDVVARADWESSLRDDASSWILKSSTALPEQAKEFALEAETLLRRNREAFPELARVFPDADATLLRDVNALLGQGIAPSVLTGHAPAFAALPAALRAGTGSLFQETGSFSDKELGEALTRALLARLSHASDAAALDAARALARQARKERDELGLSRDDVLALAEALETHPPRDLGFPEALSARILFESSAPMVVLTASEVTVADEGAGLYAWDIPASGTLCDPASFGVATVNSLTGALAFSPLPGKTGTCTLRLEFNNGIQKSSKDVTLALLPRTLSALVLPTTATRSLEALSCRTGDEPRPGRVFEAQWRRNGSAIADWAPAGSLGESALPSQEFHRGESISCALRPVEASGIGSEVVSQAIVIGNAVPALSNGGSSFETHRNMASVFSFPAVGDADGDPLAFQVVSSPTHGTLGGLTATGITYTPQADYMGSDGFSYKVCDNQNPMACSEIRQAAITVLPDDAAPTLEPIPAQSTLEDTPKNVSIVIDTHLENDVQCGPAFIEVASDDATLLPEGSLTLVGTTIGNCGVRLAPAAEKSGSAQVTVKVSDGNGHQDTQTFTLTVTPVNDAPGLAPLAAELTSEDVPRTVVLTLSDGGDGDLACNATKVSATSNNQALLPDNAITVGGSYPQCTLTMTPATNANGTAAVTVTVSDGTLSSQRNFTLTVTPVNDVPVLPLVANQTTPEETPKVVNLSLGDQGDGDLACASPKLTAISSLQTLISNGSIAVGGTFPNCTLTLTPATNRQGTSTITVIASDGALSATTSFDIVVSGVNDAPSLSDIPNQTMNEDASLPIAFTIDDKGDGDLACSTARISFISSNAALLPLSGIQLGGTFPNCTLLLTPAANGFGTSTVTVTVSDATLSAQDTFTLTVANTNDGPTFPSPIPDQSVAEDQPKTVNFSLSDGGDGDLSCTAAHVSAHSSHQGVVADSAFVLAGTFPNCSLTLAPQPDAWGSTVVEIVVTDGQLSVAESFVLTVTAANDAPVLAAVADQTTLEDIPKAVTLALNDKGEGDLACDPVHVHATSSNATLLPDENITVSGAFPACVLTLSPASGRNGSTNLIVTISDGNATATRTFALGVTPVNDTPALSAPTALSVAEDSPVSFGIRLDDKGDGDLTCGSVAVLSSNPARVANGGFTISGSFPACDVSFTPVANAWGTADLTVTVSDGTLSASGTVALTITAVNDAPALASGIAAQTTAEDTVKSVSLVLDDKGENDLACTPARIAAVSSNPAVLANAGIAVGGSYPNCTLALTPMANASGNATVILTLSDGVLSVEKTFSFSVTPVNDAPSNITLSNAVADETSLPSASVGTLGAVDADAGDSHTFTLPEGVGDNGAFLVSGNLLKMTLAPDVLTFKPGYSVTVRATDGGGLWTEKTFTVTLNNQTSLLLPLAGKTTDVSTWHHVVSTSGTLQFLNSTMPNGMSAWFDGATALRIPRHASLEMGTGDFTLEAWYSGATTNANANYARLIRMGGWGSGVDGMEIFCDQVTGNLGFAYGHTDTGLQPTNHIFAARCNDDTWHHLALVRKNGLVKTFYDGAYTSNVTVGLNFTLSEDVFVGAQDAATARWTGSIGDVRITKGNARYGDNFTPSTLLPDGRSNPDAFAPWLQLAVAFNALDRIHDAAYRIRRTGFQKTASTNFITFSTVQSKFYGASHAFNGSTNYVKFPHHASLSLGTSDFTVEAWIYPTATKDQVIAQKGGACGVAYPNWDFRLTAAGKLALSLYQGVLAAQGPPPSLPVTSTVNIPLNQWSHVAGVRAGNTVRLFINGVSENSGTLTFSPDDIAQRPVTIGMEDSDRSCGTGNVFQGYMQDLRVYRGAVKYTGAFAPPGAMRKGLGASSADFSTTAQAIFDETPIAQSGHYWLKPAGFGAALPTFLDLRTPGGPWTMVLNYVHASGTNPALNVRTTTFPTMGYGALGADESSSTGAVGSWGHAAPSLLNQLAFTRVRFSGFNSCHARVMEFFTPVAAAISYIKSGTGSMAGIGAGYTLLPGHSTNLPAAVDSTYANYGNNALTEFPFFKGGTYHWGIKGGTNRWEMDDVDGTATNACHTIHRVFVNAP